MACIEIGLRTLHVISVSEPSGTGTRNPQPPIFSFKCGNTRVNALAAPVVVGMMESAAARLLRKSL